MRDIEIAKKILEKKDHTLVVVKSGEVLFTSKEKGIKPIYKLAKEMKDESQGASIADRVIGRGAALLYTYIGLWEVYGKLISKEAMEILNEENIKYSFDKECDHIKNRDKSGLCPIEKLSLGIYDPIILLSKLDVFIK